MKKHTAILFALTLCLLPAGAENGSLQVVHSAAIERLVEQHIEYNASHSITGYRIRIFRDNSASARARGIEVRERFAQLFPSTSAYLSYDNPYVKVAAGDFRTRDDALFMLHRVKNYFPKAFIVVENIRFPPLHRADEGYQDD